MRGQEGPGATYMSSFCEVVKSSKKAEKQVLCFQIFPAEEKKTRQNKERTAGGVVVGPRSQPRSLGCRCNSTEESEDKEEKKKE